MKKKVQQLTLCVSALLLAACSSGDAPAPGGGGISGGSSSSGSSTGGNTGTTVGAGDATLDLSTGEVSLQALSNNAAAVAFKQLSGGTTNISSGDTVGNSGDGSQPANGSTLVTGFRIMQFELTQGQWSALVAASGVSVSASPWSSLPSSFGASSPTNPAFALSHDDVSAVLTAWNTANPNAQLRLPTSTEWEYACRSGTANRLYSFGDDAVDAASYATVRTTLLTGASGVQVSSDLANSYGLFDMHGNVWEWLSNGGTAGAPSLAGGSWNDNLLSASFGNRLDMPTDVNFAGAGLRLVLVTP